MRKFLTKRYITLAVIIILLIGIAIWNNSSIYDLGRWTIYSVVPLMMIAMAGLYSERSGVVNIALEAMTMIGAFVGILVLNKLQHQGISGQHIVILVVIIGGLSGALLSLLHSFASITMKSNQTISGTALNMLAVGLAIFLGRALSSAGTEEIGFTDTFLIQSAGFLSKIPIIGPILFQKFYLASFLGIAMFIVASIIAYKTKFGLRLRACGENPHAADAAGINVYKIRYISVTISGFLAGCAGVILIIPTSTSFKASVYGYGFLALAVLISGQWKPLRLMVFAFIFAFLVNLSSGVLVIQNIFLNLSENSTRLTGFYHNIYTFFRTLPRDVISMIPFIMTLVILTFTSKKSQGPKAAGEPYDQGKR